MKPIIMLLSLLLVGIVLYGCAPQKSKQATAPTENVTLSVAGMT